MDGFSASVKAMLGQKMSKAKLFGGLFYDFPWFWFLLVFDLTGLSEGRAFCHVHNGVTAFFVVWFDLDITLWFFRGHAKKGFGQAGWVLARVDESNLK